VKVFFSAVELRPTFFEAWSNMGITFKLAGDSKQSLAAQEQAYAVAPHNAAVMLPMN
jgi:Flp pilus assembly protein TadD